MRVAAAQGIYRAHPLRTPATPAALPQGDERAPGKTACRPRTRRAPVCANAGLVAAMAAQAGGTAGQCR